MERRFNRNSFTSENIGTVLTLQKKVAAENKRSVSRPVEQKAAPDLTDFMNDMFFGTASNEKKVYNLTVGDQLRDDIGNEDEFEDFDSSTRSTNGKLTQEWLEEAKHMVASSPSRGCESPSWLGGSPRFGVPQMQPPRLSLSTFDRRDPLSRSARR